MTSPLASAWALVAAGFVVVIVTASALLLNIWVQMTTSHVLMFGLILDTGQFLMLISPGVVRR
jgi:nanoRNase/pAp phosphatase (c-di-AMP/oligoRNAs hydrolase)